MAFAISETRHVEQQFPGVYPIQVRKNNAELTHSGFTNAEGANGLPKSPISFQSPAMITPPPKSDNGSAAFALGLGIAGGIAYLAGAPITVPLSLLAGGALILTGCSDSMPAGRRGDEERADGGNADPVIDGVTRTDKVLIDDLSVRLKYYHSVWTGSEYGISWVSEPADNYGIYFTRLNAEGERLSDNNRINNGRDFVGNPTVAWNHSNREYGVVWASLSSSDDNDKAIRFTTVNEQGVRSGDVISLEEEGYLLEPTLVWNETVARYGVSWSFESAQFARDRQISFLQLERNGNKFGEDSIIGSGAVLSMLWTGEEYVVHGWMKIEGHTTKRFSRHNEGGELIGEVVNLKDSMGGPPNSTMVLAGEEFGVVWYTSEDNNQSSREDVEALYFGRLSSEGDRIGDPIMIGTASDVDIDGRSSSFTGPPIIAWTGSEYGVAWVDEKEGVQVINFTRLDASGNRIDDVIPVVQNNRDDDSGPVSIGLLLVWNGKDYGLFWQESREGGWKLCFARLVGDFNH